MIAPPWIQAAAGAVIGLGLLILFAGAIGSLRFPDIYTRVHAAKLAGVLGAPIVLLGLAMLGFEWRLALKLLALAILISGAAPLAAHLVANAAHGAGLAPLSGDAPAQRRGAP